MTDEVRRISKLVAEGKLSPEDAAELIDAFYASERNEDYEARARATDATPPPTGDASDAGRTTSTQSGPTGAASHKDPLRSIVESIEKLTKEGIDSVNWTEVSKQARTNARRGFDALRTGIEEISKGKVNLGWMITSETKEIELPLVLPSGKTLRIENLCGDVKVTGGKEFGKVVAHAKFKGQTIEDARAKAEAYAFIIEESDHMVVIRQPDVSGLNVDIEIDMPGFAPVEVRSESGDVTINETGNSCRVNSRSGDVSVSGLNGVVEITGESGNVSVVSVTTPSLTLDHKSGDISVENLRGNINARTASGSVTFAKVSGKTVAVESVSGDVSIDLTSPVSGSLNVRTVSGSVSLSVPDGSDCRVSLSTLRGDVSCNLELTDEVKQDHRITGKLGAGTGTMDVSAVTGDVSVEMRDAVMA